MSYFAGIDVGSLCTKAVILDEKSRIISFAILRSGAVYKGAAEAAVNEVLKKAGLDFKQLDYIVSTGYGRERVPFADSKVTEISCHARGANFFSREAKTVIDVGGQDSKVISIDGKGHVLGFAMNDKCAAGTGRFLEIMAGALETDLEEMSELSFKAEENIEVSSMCTVFAESEVISLFAGGYAKTEICAAVFRAIARKIAGLAGQTGLIEKVIMTGGVAKSKGVVHFLEEKLGLFLVIPEDPQIVGALGGALFAREKFSRLRGLQ